MKNKKIKRNTQLFLVTGFLILFAIIIGIYTAQSNKWVAKVNGDSVTVEEFKLAIERNRSNVFFQYQKKYGIQDSSDFWQTYFDGITPEETLKEVALVDCVKARVLFKLSYDRELLEDPSYGFFLQQYELENKRRSVALKVGKPIYGPQQYKLEDFYCYVTDNLNLHLKKLLSESELLPDENQLEEFYKANIEYFYVPQKIYTEEVIMPYSNDKEKKAAEKTLCSLVEKLKSGEDFLKATQNLGLETCQMQYIADTPRLMKTSKSLEIVFELSRGDVSDIIDDVSSLCVVKCVNKTSEKYMSFEDSKVKATEYYIQEAYNMYLSQLQEQAVIETNSKLIKSLEY